ncbi:MAG: (5-formylfuran-3-yl)methyl phosphate synthase [Gemmataceae bacterium]|nr:(5-formylfuran-3-yl)methyl phosphate synthase [Gemmataceae bacterium]
MTRLLVSVRSVDEAIIARDAGADIVDIKEPRNGPLGAANASVVRRVLAAIGADVPVSAAMGELGEHLPETLASADLSFAKVGLSDPVDWRARWLAWRASLPCPAVLVAYVDLPHRDAILDSAADLRPAALLLDTCSKQTGGLLDWCSVPYLTTLINSCRANQRLLALAGSLNLDSIRVVLSLGPDIIAVRGAACEGGRDGVVCPRRVRELAELVHSVT